MWYALRGAAMALLLAAFPAHDVGAQTLPAGFVQSDAITGRTEPTAIRFARDGRVFVAEKSGLIWLYDNLVDATPTQVADLRTMTHNFWDRGLLGFALDPAFPQRPQLYVLLAFDAGIGGTPPRWGTAGGTGDPCPNPPGATNSGGGCVVAGRLLRLTLAGTTVGAPEVLVEDWFQQYPSHSIGQLAFGADGYLYASAGDGASFNFTDWGQSPNPNFPDPHSPANEGGALRSQDLETGPTAGDPVSLDGTVIRIDPATGLAAPTNPLAGDAALQENARRIVAYGLRNPFRMTARPGTSEMWLGDVGWNAWEEINVVPAVGAVPPTWPVNFGWPCWEGTGRQSGYDGANLPICENLYAGNAQARSTHRLPFYAYRHNRPATPPASGCTGSSSAISGLAFYTGAQYPASWQNALFFSDYNRDQIFALRDSDGDGLPNAPTTSPCGAGTPEPSDHVFLTGFAAADPVEITAGPGGDLFYVSLAPGSAGNGRVRRIHFGANRAPSAAIDLAAGSTVGGPARTVGFVATNSVDPDAGATLSYAWDLDGDGDFDDATGSSASRVYSAPGSVRVAVRVTDQAGAGDMQSLTIQVADSPPQIVLTTPDPALFRWSANTTFPVAVSVTDAVDGTLGGASVQWSVNLEHCSDETFLDCHEHTLGTFSGSSGTIDAPEHEFPSYIRAVVVATNSRGLQATESYAFYPATGELTLASSPAALQVQYGSEPPATAPLVRRAIVGSTVSMSVENQQTLAGTVFRFRRWSDGSTATARTLALSGTTPVTLTAEYAPIADARVTVSSGRFNVLPNDAMSYAIGVHNDGPNPIAGLQVSFTPPAALADVAWTCTASAGSCAASGTGAIADSISLPAGASASYTVTARIRADAATGPLAVSASATVPASSIDPTPANNTATDTDTIQAPPPPTVTITTPAAPLPNWRVAQSIAVAGNASDWTGAALAGAALQWTVLRRACSDETLASCTETTHATFDGAGGSFDTGAAPPFPGEFLLRLVATDVRGAGSTAELALRPAVTELALTTEPAGLTLSIGGDAPAAAPRSRRAVTGGTLAVAAPTPQTLAGTRHVFTGWADGGTAPNREFVLAAPGPLAATARFAAVTDVTLATLPAGLTVRFDGGAPVAAPATREVRLDSGVTIATDAEQSLGGIVHGFQSWSNGGARSQLLTGLGGTPLTLTATFAPLGDPSIAIDSDRSSVDPGGTVVYTVRARNLGPNPLAAIPVSIVPGPGHASVTWTCSASAGSSCSATGTGAVADAATLAPAGLATYVLTTRVAADAPAGPLTLAASVGLPSGHVDPAPSDNAASSSVAVVDPAAPSATITAPAAGTLWRVGTPLALAASASDWLGSPLPGSALAWELVLNQCQAALPATCASSTVASFTGAGGSATVPAANAPAHLLLRLVATDGRGKTTRLERRLEPLLAEFSFATVPSGLALAVDTGAAEPTPFSRAAIVGSNLPLMAAATQFASGVEYRFQDWSHGGPAVQSLAVTSPGSATLSARYAALADVALALVPPGGVVAGERLRYSLRATNRGAGRADGVRLAHQPPAWLKNASWTCSPESGGSCSAAAGNGAVDLLLSIAAGASVTVVVEGNATPAGSTLAPISAALSPASGHLDPEPGDNAASVTPVLLAPALFEDGFETR